jgi:hypothetical protein
MHELGPMWHQARVILDIPDHGVVLATWTEDDASFPWQFMGGIGRLMAARADAPKAWMPVPLSLDKEN